MQTSVQFMTCNQAGTADVSQVQIEGLEWGKYCDTPDGPVVNGAEHGLLGFSSGFPRLLRALCQPDDLGISTGPLEEEAQRLFEKSSWGTALRPAAFGSDVFLVLYRIGVRSEAGTILGRRRKYSLARYLVDPGKVASPLALFKAMTPLAGLTREIAGSLRPIQTTSFFTALEDMVPEPFLRQALTCIISGVPIHIKEGETEFFRLVDEVWQALPVKLRPWLSAGWNVSSSVASELAIFSSVVPLEHAAIYSSGAWSLPSALRNGLAPGKLYSALRFPSAQNESGALVEKYLDKMELPAAFARQGLRSVPGFHDPRISSQFQYAGISILESEAADRLRLWLETGKPDMTSRIAVLVKHIQDRPELRDLILHGLAAAGSRQRADHLAWVFLKGKGTLYSEDQPLNQPGTARGALLQAVARQDANLTLKSLPAAAETGELEGLPEEVSEGIRQLLPSTLENLESHLELLTNPAAAAIYEPWARKNAIELAFRFAADMRIAKPALEQLQRLCSVEGPDGSLLNVIRALLSGRHITQEDRAILSRISPQQFSRFGLLFETVWVQSESCGIDRESLLDWCTSLPGYEYSEPVLMLASGSSISASQIETLAQGSARLPRKLWPRLSEAALRASRDLHVRIRKDPGLWAPIVSLWPGQFTLALLGVEFEDIPRPTDLTEIALAPAFIPRAELIQDRIEDWLLNPEPRKLRPLPEVAPVLWEWIAALHEPRSSSFKAVDICWCLTRKRFVKDAELSQSPFDDAGLAMTLARLSGCYQELMRDAQLLWASAIKGWQVRFLLELFPLVSFSPSGSQLSVLVPFRSWLLSHLDRKDIASGRRAAFKVGASDFHGILFPGRDDEQWRAEWQDTVLGAAYRGSSAPVPRLRDVLEAYARTRAECGQICLKNLSDAGGEEEFEQALSRVLDDFLFPAAVSAGLTVEQLVRALRGVGNPGSKCGLQVVAGSHREPFERSGTGAIQLADYMVPLFWSIANRGYSSMVQKAIEKNYAARTVKF